MIGTYKDFFNFTNNISPFICELWEDYNNRKDPKQGDMFLIKQADKYVKGTFNKIIFDNTFENGVAFFYIFIVNDKEIKIRSINNVYDNDKLTLKERRDMYRFWVDCKPIDKELEK